MKNPFITIALSIQLFLAFFCPPIPFGERLLFLSDIWCFIWTPLFLILVVLNTNVTQRRSLIFVELCVFLTLGLIYFHGYFRPPPTLSFSNYVGDPSEFHFHPAKEALIAFRFAMWISAGLVVSKLRPNSKMLLKVLAGSASLAAISMVASFVFPSFHFLLGKIFHYDPDAFPWSGRIYGVFRSPIEGSVALCLSFLILLNLRRTKSSYRWASLTLILVGIILSKTITSAIAVAISVGLAFLSKTEKRTRTKLLLALTGTVLVGVALLRNVPFFQEKMVTFSARARGWDIYLDLISSRFDLLVLGLGFQPHYSDSNYLFLISRGGVFLFSLAVIATVLAGRKYWKDWSPLQRTIPIFFAVSGLTVDSLILRPVVYALVCVGIPVLMSRSSR